MRFASPVLGADLKWITQVFQVLMQQNEKAFAEIAALTTEANLILRA